MQSAPLKADKHACTNAQGLGPESTYGSHPRVEQCLCQEVGSSADKFSLEVPTTDAPLGFVPSAGHDITPCLLLKPTNQGSFELQHALCNPAVRLT